jgi:hydroxymethylpyrimidine/phosphomethylpyrimidine kinase
VRSVALTIAGSDSGGGAGVIADAKTFQAHGVWGAVAVTAVTAQNTLGVKAVHLVPPDVVRAQILAVISDLTVGAAKTGMLGSAEVAAAVAAAVGRPAPFPMVIDPVLVATSGEALFDGAAEVLSRLLVPMAAVVTPNLAEAGALVGSAVRDRQDMAAAAAELVGRGAGAALVTGGHSSEVGVAADCLVVSGYRRPIWLEGRRLDQPHAHGTGCVLSAAVTAGLAMGNDVETACRRAKAFVVRAIAAGFALGAGTGPVDPGAG